MVRTGFGSAGIAVVILTSATPLANAASAPAIFRCVENDVIAYSDRPCGSNASEYEPSDARISILEVTPPAPTKPARVKPKPARVDMVSIAEAQIQRARDCAKIELSMRDIRSKMRAGYDVKEGERLRDRERKLTAQQRELRC
jgi:hypothetical protein